VDDVSSRRRIAGRPETHTNRVEFNVVAEAFSIVSDSSTSRSVSITSVSSSVLFRPSEHGWGVWRRDRRPKRPRCRTRSQPRAWVPGGFGIDGDCVVAWRGNAASFVQCVFGVDGLVVRHPFRCRTRSAGATLPSTSAARPSQPAETNSCSKRGRPRVNRRRCGTERLHGTRDSTSFADYDCDKGTARHPAFSRPCEHRFCFAFFSVSLSALCEPAFEGCVLFEQTFARCFGPILRRCRARLFDGDSPTKGLIIDDLIGTNRPTTRSFFRVDSIVFARL